jgi:hypothetical protein
MRRTLLIVSTLLSLSSKPALPSEDTIPIIGNIRVAVPCEDLLSECATLVSDCKKVLAEKDRTIDLKNLAIDQSNKEIGQLSLQVQEADAKLESPLRNPFFTVMAGVVLGVLVTTYVSKR